MAEVRVTRRFDVPPERVFDAWVTPPTARSFLFATPTGEVVRCDLDARPGGRFTITDRRPDVGDVDHVGEYEVVDRPSRLAFTFGVPAFSPEMTRVTLDIAPDAAGTHLTLTHENVLEDWAERTEQGWGMILDTLATALQ